MGIGRVARVDETITADATDWKIPLSRSILHFFE
jgi:hypothetical protein